MIKSDVRSGGGRRTNQLFFIHSETQTGETTVRFCRNSAEAEAQSAKYEGRYKYVVGSLAELVSAQLPSAVLLQIFNRGRLLNPLRVFKHRQRIERKVWEIMKNVTKDEQNQAQKDSQNQAVAEKKTAAEAKATKAAEKAAAVAAKAKEKEDAKAAKEKAAADKKAAAEAAKAEKAAAKAAARQPKETTSRIKKDEVIQVLVDKNPKREGSEAHKRFALYNSGMTVGQFIDAGGTMADVSWDFGHRLISLTPAVSQEQAS